MSEGLVGDGRPADAANCGGGWSLGVHLLLPIVSLELFALSFPKPGWWPLIFFALVPMGWLALVAPCARRLAWTTYVVSYVGWLALMRWMIPVTFGGWWAMCLYLALHFPAALLVFRLLVQRWRLPAALALPMAWVSLEWLRGHFPAGGFGWYVLGHALAPWQVSDSPPLLAQAASIFGELGLSFFIAMNSGWLIDFLRSRSPGLAPGPFPGPRWTLALVLASWAGLLGHGWAAQQRFEQEYPTRSTAVVALVQTNLPQYNKESPTPGRLQEEWERLLAMSRQAVLAAQHDGGDVQLLLWTETIVPRPLDDQSLIYIPSDPDGLPGSAYYHQQIVALAQELNVHLLVGTPWWHWERYRRDDGLDYVRPAGSFNVAALYRPDGKRDPVHYAKMHRVPFGEYVPWVENWPWLKRLFIRYLTPYEFDYTLQPGKLPVVFQIPLNGDQGNQGSRGLAPEEPPVASQEGQADPGGDSPLRVVAPICFEDAVPRVCRKLVYDAQGRKRADLIANLTNDGWFAGTHQPWQHLQIASLRSIELGVPTARAVNTGISGFINSWGQIEKLVTVDGRPQDVAGAAAHRLALDPRSTFFGNWSDLPMRIMVIVTAALTAAGAVKHRRSQRPGPSKTGV